MDKDKILDYVRKTPANTNPNVLKTMLDDSGGEMNPGYSCTETVTLLTDESVTTVFDEVNNSGKLAYSTSIDADTIRVTFDGTEYTCNAQEGEMGTLYGAPMGEEGIDWSEYPFQISSGLRNDIYTETAGTYQIKIETVEEVVETTPCFEKAVNSVVGGGSGGGGDTNNTFVIEFEEYPNADTTQSHRDVKTVATVAEINEAFASGKVIVCAPIHFTKTYAGDPNTVGEYDYIPVLIWHTPSALYFAMFDQNGQGNGNGWMGTVNIDGETYFGSTGWTTID